MVAPLASWIGTWYSEPISVTPSKCCVTCKVSHRLVSSLLTVLPGDSRLPQRSCAELAEWTLPPTAPPCRAPGSSLRSAVAQTRPQYNECLSTSMPHILPGLRVPYPGGTKQARQGLSEVDLQQPRCGMGRSDRTPDRPSRGPCQHQPSNMSPRNTGLLLYRFTLLADFKACPNFKAFLVWGAWSATEGSYDSIP
jgi:hypothetical protein